MLRAAVLLAMVVAVLLSLTSAAAQQTAAVVNPHLVAVTSTDSALLGLAPGTGDGNAAQTAAYLDALTRDTLILDFRKGLGGSASYGFGPKPTGAPETPGSIFRYRGLFQVTNRSTDQQCVSVFVPGGSVSDLAAIRVRSAGAGDIGWLVAGVGGTKSGCQLLDPGAVFDVDVWWEIVSTSTGTFSFAVRVEGTR